MFLGLNVIKCNWVFAYFYGFSMNYVYCFVTRFEIYMDFIAGISMKFIYGMNSLDQIFVIHYTLPKVTIVLNAI